MAERCGATVRYCSQRTQSISQIRSGPGQVSFQGHRHIHVPRVSGDWSVYLSLFPTGWV